MINSSLDVNLEKFFCGRPNYTQVDIEDLTFDEKIESIERFFINSNIISLKLYYWEQDCQIQQFVRNFNYDFVTLKPYKGRVKPGVILIQLQGNDICFIRNVLFNHFNADFSQNPYLNIRPYFLVQNKSNSILLEIYDDRGFNVFYEF